jgi:Na+/glutamate symporter
MTDDLENGNGDNGYGLIVKVSKWRWFIQAWLQKLLSTMISAKVMMCLIALWIIYRMMAFNYEHDIILVGKDGVQEVVTVYKPYLTGQDGASAVTTIIVALIGARLVPQMITAVGGLVSASRKGT